MTGPAKAEAAPRRGPAVGALDSSKPASGPRPRLAPALSLLALPLLLGACSSLFFDDEELEPQSIQLQDQKAPDPDFPTLASVPEEPPLPSASAQRQELLEGLAADRTNARYSDQPLTPESVAAEAAGPSDLAYPPPPVLAGAAEATSSQTAAAIAPPASGAALGEPAMPAPPVAPPAPVAASEPLQDGGFNAPPPPLVTAAGQSMPEPPLMTAGGAETAYPAPTGLLQDRAFQQQALADERLQQLAVERQAFDEQARRQAIELQWQREQMIQQQRAQWRYPAGYQQLAALPGAVPAAAPAYPVQQAYQAAAPYQVPPAGSAGSGQLVGLIYFGHGSARLDARDQQVLQQVVELQRSQGRSLRVVGHASARTEAADIVQHDAKNQAMAVHRAQAVAQALVGLGADGSRISVDGAGDEQPVFHEFTTTGEAGNRRVEIFLE